MNLWIVGFSNVHTQIGRGLLLPYFEIPAMREPKRRNEGKSRFRAFFYARTLISNYIKLWKRYHY